MKLPSIRAAAGGTQGRLLALGLLGCSAVAVAATPIDETRPLQPNAQVSVSNIAGSIRISSWDRDAVGITGSLGDGALELRIQGTPDKLDIAVVPRKNNHDMQPTELVLQLPAGVHLGVESVSADVEVVGLRGPLQVNSVSGDVDLELQSPSVDLRSVSGDLRLSAPSRQTRISTVSGDIDATGLGGRLALETVSGNATVAGSAFERIDLKTISGDIDGELSLLPQAVLVGESLSGNLRLQMPSTTSAVLRARSFSGDIDSGFGGAVAASTRSKGLELQVNDGSARVDLSSFSGDIALLPR